VSLTMVRRPISGPGPKPRQAGILATVSIVTRIKYTITKPFYRGFYEQVNHVGEADDRLEKSRVHGNMDLMMSCGRISSDTACD
jgi:hypothetical protein